MADLKKILIVDDDKDIIEFLEYNLKKEGFSIKTAYNGEDAIEIAKKYQPDLILLDVMMSGKDGIETCEQLRLIPELNNPIIAMLTARGEDYSQIAGFEAGADDYITKPIKPKVLISRMNALLKRSRNSNKNIDISESPIIKINNLVINKEQYIVSVGDEDLMLPRKEFELLVLLATKPGNVFTRDVIYDKIWGDTYVGDRTIDVHIRKLREKLGDNNIKTIKGVGYKYCG
jgi:two-component system alkaline phosphatase synthesis response regulator PhoP